LLTDSPDFVAAVDFLGMALQMKVATEALSTQRTLNNQHHIAVMKNKKESATYRYWYRL
jgi:hypothetical protein